MKRRHEKQKANKKEKKEENIQLCYLKFEKKGTHTKNNTFEQKTVLTKEPFINK